MPEGAGQQRRLGLALSGGGARGFAHVGVLQALEQAGFGIHCLSGTSVGALIAVGYALDGLGGLVLACMESPDDLRALFRDRLRLQSSNPLGRRIAERTEGIRIEDLRPRLAICAVDLLTRQHVVLREGPLLPALQASISVPFLAQPVLRHGRYLADAGRERFSALRSVRELGAEVVVEVLLYPGNQLEPPPQVERALRPFLRALDAGARRRPPGRRATLRFALDLATRRKPRVRPADLLLAPDVLAIGMRSHHSARRAFRAGYVAAHERLPHLRHLLAACTA